MKIKNKEIVEIVVNCQKHGLIKHFKKGQHFFCYKCDQIDGLVFGRSFNEIKKYINLKYSLIETK